MNRLSLEDRAKILSCLVDGNNLCATTRVWPNLMFTSIIPSCMDWEGRPMQSSQAEPEAPIRLHARRPVCGNAARPGPIASGQLEDGVTFMFVGKDADTVDYEDYH